MGEFQCLSSQGEPGCQKGVQKRALQWEKSPVSAAVCSPGNPASKAVAVEKKSRWKGRSFSEVGFPCHTAKLLCRQSLLPAELQWSPVAGVSGRVTDTLTHCFKAAAF